MQCFAASPAGHCLFLGELVLGGGCDGAVGGKGHGGSSFRAGWGFTGGCSKNKAAPHGTALYFCRLFAQIEALVETINAAAGIHQLLLAGKERMALGADFDADLGDSGDGLQRVTAGAANYSRAILGMDAFFHAISPLSNSWRQC